MNVFLDRYFSLTQLGTTVRSEVVGGATTFITMAYIIIVNPKILEAAGIHRRSCSRVRSRADDCRHPHADADHQNPLR